MKGINMKREKEVEERISINCINSVFPHFCSGDELTQSIQTG
jgi:hypothetical protein